MIAACLVAVCCAVVGAVFLALGQGSLTQSGAVCSILIGMIGGAWCGVATFRRTPRKDWKLVEGLLAIVFALFALRAFCWLVYPSDEAIKVLSPNNLGDMSLHLTYIRYLANGARFWPANPIFSDTPLHYPIGMDLFNALLTLLQVDLFRGLIWVGLIGCGFCAITLHRWGGSFAVAGFLFNGGLAGWQFFERFHFEDYNDTVAWKSIPLAMLVTQRGLLYAIPAGLLLLTSWRARWFEKEGQRSLPAAVELLLFATLPLFHFHTFVFLSALLAYWALINAGGSRRGALSLLALSFVPAAFFVSLVTGLFRESASAAGHVVHITAGWMQGGENPVKFWLLNFGFLPFYGGALLFLVVRRFRTHPAARTAAAFVVPSLLVFLTACFVMLAPWEWDNTKIMIWSYLAILPFLERELISQLPVPARAVSYLLLFFSGFISLFGGLNRSHAGHEIANRVELDGVTAAMKDLRFPAVVAGYPTYNHPVMLSGHPMVEGYEGHLFSHGIDYKPRLEKLSALMEGEAGWRQIARELHVRYLFWGTREKEHYPDSLAPWRVECEVVASGSWGEIYDVAD